MKELARVFLVAACLLGSAAISNANSIVNGSFEDPFCGGSTPCSPGGNWGLFESIPGWTSPVGVIEIGAASVYGITGHHGNQVLELDATGNATVAQVVAGTGTYTLSFLYADRVGGLVESFDVFWNGGLVASLFTPPNPPGGVMSPFSTTVVATGAFNTLEFRGTGVSDSFGALIDDVQLNSVPDGGLTALLVGMGFFGLGFARRMMR